MASIGVGAVDTVTAASGDGGAGIGWSVGGAVVISTVTATGVVCSFGNVTGTGMAAATTR